MDSKKTVTIGIPAHNEEQNIGFLLEAILQQKGDNFLLEKIIVSCDGCSDHTAKIVGEFSKKNALISVVDDGKRLGKNTRLNNFYKNLESDIFVSFDADVVILDNNVILELVKSFENDKIGLVGGRVLPLPQKGLITKALSAYEYFWAEVVKNINHGDNVQSHTGPITAGTKQFLKNIQIPSKLPDDHFLYFKAIQDNFLYKHNLNAKVYIKIPTTFSDYMKQRTRFLNSAHDIRNYFGDWIDKYYAVPFSVKIYAYKQTFKKYPWHLFLALCLVATQRLLSFRYLEKNQTGFWSQVQSSK